MFFVGCWIQATRVFLALEALTETLMANRGVATLNGGKTGSQLGHVDPTKQHLSTDHDL